MDKLDKYLKEFKIESDKWFSNLTWLVPRYKFFTSFFEDENLKKAEWKDFQEMGDNLHCFITNPLAKKNAFGRPNDSIENYRMKFEYLIRGDDPLNIRLNNLNEKKSNYKIKFISDSALSELIGYAYPNDFTFYNSRSKKALQFLDIKLESKKSLQFGDTFLSYNNSIKPVIDAYRKIVGKKTLTTIPLEVDQFFSWLYEAKIKPTEAKYDFFPILKKFIDQAQTENQKYSSYPKVYKDLELDVKFGQGGLSHIPYLALLKEPNIVPDGIYPVYLFYKKENILILSYGISETNTTSMSWPNSNQLQTIHSWYLNEYNEKPHRYGASYVKSVYNILDELDPEKIQNDLDEMLEIYKQMDFTTNENTIKGENTKFEFMDFHKKTKEAGLKFSQKIVGRLAASLCTKPFVICSGLSGSGKTKLAQSFVKWICKTEEQYKIVPVGADWTNREPLLGFPNGLDPSQYVFPDSGVLQLIICANKKENKDKPYFLILDEMNLSHVERYFADFLSIMESHDKIKLYSGADRFDSKNENNKIDQEISWPPNLFIIGTVNIDETTYMFSPKVLDRANVIEFRISKDEMAEYLSETSVVDMSNFINPINNHGYGSSMGFDFLEKSNKKLSKQIVINETLLSFFEELRKCGAEFGFRSASEIARLISVLSELRKESAKWDKVEISDNDFIDIAIMQKLLPKIHGSRTKLTKVLPVLGGLCLKNNKEKIKENYFDKFDSVKINEDDNVLFKLSFEKICRMHKNAIENGYASYAEA